MVNRVHITYVNLKKGKKMKKRERKKKRKNQKIKAKKRKKTKINELKSSNKKFYIYFKQSIFIILQITLTDLDSR